MTGLYWAWKNLDVKYLGLVHYRRYFTLKSKWYRKKHDNMECVLTKKEAEYLMEKYDIVVPKKQKYIIETLYTHYAHTHYKAHLDQTREIIQKQCPEYLNDYDSVVNSRAGHMFNMFIMSKEYLDDYCAWLFPILFELEKNVDAKNLSAFQQRFYGRVSEIIFNCWIRNKARTAELRIKEIPYFYLGRVDWKRKIIAFLKAKFLHIKYEGSF